MAKTVVAKNFYGAMLALLKIITETSKMTIGVVVAMQSEFELVAKMLQNAQKQKIKHLDVITGKCGNQEIVLVQSGIGKVNAAATVVELINAFAPAKIINTGLAGGIGEGLQVMDVVAALYTGYHDVWCGDGNEYGQVQGLPTLFEGDHDLLNKVMQIKDDSLHQGLIVSGDKFVSDLAELQAIKAKFPKALAVDMESAAMAQICYLYHVPFLALRIISDTPGVENHFAQYLDFWNKAPEKSLEIIKKILA